MKVAICDDDYRVCQCIEKTILEYGRRNQISIDVEVIQSGESLMNTIDIDTDLLFLDIMLPDYTGIEIGHFLRNDCENMDLQIVFISANPEYALDLFKIRPMDFLIKPFTEKELVGILDDYFKIHIPQMKYFVLKSRSGKQKIFFKDIMYLASSGRCVDIYLRKNQTVTIYSKLKDVEKELPKDVFWRIHQSYIVNQYYIRTCYYDRISLMNEQTIPISKVYRKEISKRIMNE